MQHKISDHLINFYLNIKYAFLFCKINVKTRDICKLRKE